MALTADNVRVPVTGGVYVGPTGTTPPSDATTGLDAGFTDLGYISEDGISQSIDDNYEHIRAWQRNAKVRVLQTEFDLTFSFKMIETSPGVLEQFYGNHASGATSIKGGALPIQSWVFNLVDDVSGAPVAGRIYVPRGQITSRDEISYVNGEAIEYGVSLETLTDDSGNNAYLFGLLPA